MDEKPRKTLTDFVEQNQKLLSTIGVFTALSVFINQLPGDLAKSDQNLHMGLRMLSCLLCILAILAYIEVLKNAFSYPEQGLIRWFNQVLFLAFAVFVYVWGRTFIIGIVGVLAMLVMMVLFVLSLTLFALLIQTIMKHTSLLKSRSQRTREYPIPLFGSLVLMVIAIFVLQRLHR